MKTLIALDDEEMQVDKIERDIESEKKRDSIQESDK